MNAERKPASHPPTWLLNATAPVARAVAGRRWFPLWAVIHHRGRTSGTAYATPIAVIPTRRQDIFLIGLPWGAKTNWARNVLAAEGATVRWRGRDYAATEPRIVGPEVAVALAKGPVRRVVGSGRFPAFLELRR